jgi:hypothetical protein
VLLLFERQDELELLDNKKPELFLSSFLQGYVSDVDIR